MFQTGNCTFQMVIYNPSVDSNTWEHRTGTNVNSWFSITHKRHRWQTGENRSGKPRLQLCLWEWIPESSEGGYLSVWAPFFVAQVLRTRALISLASCSEMPRYFSYTQKKAVKSWVEWGLFFSLLWCICSMNLSLHVSVLPQLPLDTCYISSAQICALEAAHCNHHHHLPFPCPSMAPIPMTSLQQHLGCSRQQKVSLDPGCQQSNSHPNVPQGYARK